jgi:hypothetical protein
MKDKFGELDDSAFPHPYAPIAGKVKKVLYVGSASGDLT